MTVTVTQPTINVREKLNELDKPTGIAGEAMLRAETPQEQFQLIGAGRRNMIINGAMEIYQRNTAFSGSSGYSLDRWKVQQDAGVDTTCSQVDVSSGTGPYAKGHRKALQIAVTNTSTASTFYAQAAYYMEGFDASKMGINASGGNHITLSFWVKNSVGGQYYAFVDDAKSGFRYTFGYTVEANVWEYVTVTIPPKDGMVIDNDNSIEFRVVFPAYYAADFTAADAVLNQWHSHNGAKFTPDFPTQWSNVSGATLQITGIQLELGKVATPFEHRSYGEELALCQRYYVQYELASYQRLVATSYCDINNRTQVDISLPVPLRSYVSAGHTNLTISGQAVNVINLTQTGSNSNIITGNLTCPGTPLTVGTVYQVYAIGTGNFYVNGEL